ncbi:Testis-expressed protein [Armadillidium nasatum]|uniref:Testis-expressed protein n=1 Tax=Armadillidium nasatum TaxID=96803 RepID=A0A5N5SKX2_9CRUS|nr:Testis-expressed protein [Armadillidium nasatum]
MLDEYIERRSLCAHPFIEVYDNKCRKIYFIGPLERQDKFYVPEILENEDTLQGRSAFSKYFFYALVDTSSEEEDKDEEDHSVSWDESASYINKELSSNKGLTPPPRSGGADEDSDHTTGSSFEEIDEKDAPEIKEEEEMDQVVPLSVEPKTEL